MGLDAGPESIKLFTKTILASKTILWNGPAGVFEFDNFAKGSKATLDACIEAKNNGATVIVGGVSYISSRLGSRILLLTWAGCSG